METLSKENKVKLSAKNYTLISSMLFGLFFGAGNLIFPLIMGAKAGSNLLPSIIGMIITAVGFPLLGVVSMGVSRSEGLMHMSSRVSKGYGYFFTCAVYLTIGPFFAIPRCAATSFSIGINPILPSDLTIKIIIQVVFTLLFFAAVLVFSLRPSKIMETVGKWLNPAFLILLAVLIITVLATPVPTVPTEYPNPVGDYTTGGGSFVAGFLQGYDTLDALASLAFGIIVINVIRGHGVEEPKAIAMGTVKSGAFSMGFMAVIYALIALVGAKSYGLFAEQLATVEGFSGGDAFPIIASHYLGVPGQILLALIVTFCCLKTAIGLVTSCSETFSAIFPKFLNYKIWAIIFTAFSFLVSNIGLSYIIQFSAPVLYFLYPLAIVLIITSLFGKLFGHSQCVYVSTILFTMIAAVFDLIRVSGIEALNVVIDWIAGWWPLYKMGLGWIVPAVVGFGVGMLFKFVFKIGTKEAKIGLKEVLPAFEESDVKTDVATENKNENKSEDKTDAE